MTTRTISAWLFDIYPASNGVTLWLIDRNGEKHRCSRRFTPSFFLELNENDRRRAAVLAGRCPVPVTLEPATQRDLYSGDWLNVMRVSVLDPTRFRQAVAYFEKFFPHFAFFHSDILPAQLFLYETDLFALGYGDYTLNENGELAGWTLLDSREEFEYTLPPLSLMTLRNANTFLPPKYQKILQLEVGYEGATYTLEQETAQDMLESLNWHLHRYNPDIILTDYGDSILMPKITRLATQLNIPLMLNRDVDSDYKISKQSSFFQYGKVVHKDGSFELRGRWHVDARNSFSIIESDLDGLFELTRVTQLCPQHQARASIGTGLSSLQLSWAYRNNYLIPAKKREPEEFKSASTLLMSDRGGLIYMPPLGYHEDVAELDFVSMYPAIMVNFNVSPETVNCRCCENHKVPELGYSICERREGIVAATLRPLIAKRAYYKKKKKEFKETNSTMHGIYERRQNALKWMFVSCFGYLGYKNARFGRIEGHEAVNAFSRDIILTAKEIAEAAGYELIHGIIDCIWLKKKGATESDYEQLCRTIATTTQIDISLEGIYKWILFPASKTDPGTATGGRYVGAYASGEMKLRGIEARRHDTPNLIKAMQRRMLDVMAGAGGMNDLGRLVPELLDITREYLALVKTGRANPMDLVLHRYLTKAAQEYAKNTITANVAKLIDQAGVHLMAGESIDFIIVDQAGKSFPEKARPLSLYAFEDGYDIEKYVEFVLDATATLLHPFGYDYPRLEEMFTSKAKNAKSHLILGQKNSADAIERLNGQMVLNYDEENSWGGTNTRT